MSLGSEINTAVSFVEKIGKDIMHVLQDGAAVVAKVQPVANFVGNIVATVDPELAPAVKLVLTAATYVEGQFAAAGQASGTGEQKAQIVEGMTGDTIAYFLKLAGKANDAAAVQAFISKIVDLGKNDPAIWEELLTMLGQSAPAVPSLGLAAAAAAAASHS